MPTQFMTQDNDHRRETGGAYLKFLRNFGLVSATMTMTRQQFLRSIVGLGLGAGALAACSNDDGGGGHKDAPASTGNCLANGTFASIQANHGHTLMVPIADLNAGVDKT